MVKTVSSDHVTISDQPNLPLFANYQKVIKFYARDMLQIIWLIN